MNKQNTDKTFFEYCTALTQFYGIIHVKEAFDIIQFQNDAQYNLEDFLKYVEQMQETRFDPNDPLKVNSYFVLADLDRCKRTEKMYLVNDCFESECYGEGEPETLNNLLLAIDKLERYIPSKEELVKHADDGYYEKTQELEVLCDFVLAHQCKLPMKLTRADIESEVILPIQMDSSCADAYKGLCKWIDWPEDPKAGNSIEVEMVRLINGVFWNTRQWLLCGHKPIELDNRSATAIDAAWDE